MARFIEGYEFRVTIEDCCADCFTRIEGNKPWGRGLPAREGQRCERCGTPIAFFHPTETKRERIES